MQKFKRTNEIDIKGNPNKKLYAKIGVFDIFYPLHYFV